MEIIKLEKSILSKQVQKSKAANLIQAVVDGGLNPIHADSCLKAMENIIDTIRKDVFFKTSLNHATGQYAEKTIIFENFEITKTSKKTYDCTTCIDSVWNELNAEMEKIKAKMKDREEFLKRVPATGVANPETGEMIFLPASKNTESLTYKFK